MEEKIRVMVAEDLPLLREDFCDVVSAQDDMEMVGAASSGEEIVALAAKTPCDVILMDIEMESIDAGIRAAEIITILRRNAGMPHTMAMGQSYGRRFLSQVLPRLDRSILALEGDEALENGLRILLSATIPLLCEGILAEDPGPIRARYQSYLTILKGGMLR